MVDICFPFRQPCLADQILNVLYWIFLLHREYIFDSLSLKLRIVTEHSFQISQLADLLSIESSDTFILGLWYHGFRLRCIIKMRTGLELTSWWCFGFVIRGLHFVIEWVWHRISVHWLRIAVFQQISCWPVIMTFTCVFISDRWLSLRKWHLILDDWCLSITTRITQNVLNVHTFFWKWWIREQLLLCLFWLFYWQLSPCTTEVKVIYWFWWVITLTVLLYEFYEFGSGSIVLILLINDQWLSIISPFLKAVNLVRYWWLYWVISLSIWDVKLNTWLFTLITPDDGLW